MKPRAEIVQSVFDFAIREINALEGRIVIAEDDADEMLWEQARQVVAQIDAGLSQVKLAAQWINGRTGETYSRRHVQIVLEIVTCYLNSTPRPRFRDKYNEITNKTNATRLVHNSGDFEWNTPAAVIEAARLALGSIDLDPASNAAAQEVVQATRFFTRDDDGLKQAWSGRVWMNPPYVYPLIEDFSKKLADHIRDGSVTAAVAIVNNTTETQWFRTLADVGRAVCFPTGRVCFWKPDADKDGPLQGQALFYMGPMTGRFSEAFSPFGPVWFK